MLKFHRHLLLNEVRVEPGREWREERSGWLFLRLHKGIGYWLGKGTAKEVGPGQVLIAPPQTEGELRASQLSEARFHYFHFCPELAADFLTSFEEHFLDKAAAKAGQQVRIEPPEQTLARAFASLVEEGRGDNTFAVRAQMLRIASMAFSPDLTPPREHVVSGGSVEQRFKTIIQQIPESELVKHSPEELAALCECSTRHFSRLFRKHFGTTIRSRQTELRMMKARQLLLETDFKITHVALESGYRHLGLFNMMFKKHVGMTPSEWKQKELRKTVEAEAVSPAGPERDGELVSSGRRSS